MAGRLTVHKAVLDKEVRAATSGVRHQFIVVLIFSRFYPVVASAHQVGQ